MPDEGRIVDETEMHKVGKQIKLPWSKAVEIAIKSMKIRFGRSLVTTASIILAIAFLMSVWTGGVFNRALAQVPSDNKLYALVQGVLEWLPVSSEGFVFMLLLFEDHQQAVVDPGAARDYGKVWRFVDNEQILSAVDDAVIPSHRRFGFNFPEIKDLYPGFK